MGRVTEGTGQPARGGIRTGRGNLRDCQTDRLGKRLGQKSRMKRELPVRFREGLGVKFPRATRLVMGFACEEDARRVLEVLPKRFGRFGLTLHPEKTRLVPFQRPAQTPTEDSRSSETPPGTFDLLGFTHYWGRSRRGSWVVKRKTASSRLSRALQRIADWCRKNLHEPMTEQCQKLGQKLRGHFAYYGITGNARALQVFRYRVTHIWHKWLGRRHRRGSLSWATFTGFLQRCPLPQATVVHSVYRRVANPRT